MIKAILFDLDGVLIDACEWHYLSLNQALKETNEYEISRQDHESNFNGLPTMVKLGELVKLGAIDLKDIPIIWDLKQKYTKSIIKNNANIDHDKIMIHQYLIKNGISIACVTNSIQDTATIMLDVTGQLPFINLLLANDMVRYPKPHGEGYIKAMVKLQSLPEETLIVEDSPKGLQAARSTGAHVWQVEGYQDVVLKNLITQLDQYA